MLENIRKNIENILEPYRTIFIFLIILVIINAQFQGFNEAIISTIIALFTSLGTDILLTYLKTKKIIFSYGPAISGLILALVFSPNLSFYYIAGTAFLAQILKHIIRYNNNNIFNPASLAMILVFIFLPAEVWWGNKIPEALILGLVVSWRIKKIPASLSFIIGFTILNILFLLLQSKTLNYIIDNLTIASAWVFFAFFMLVEPRTSPRSFKAQVLYGLLIALISSLGFLYGTHSPILLALLAANAANAFYLNKVK